MTWQIAFGIEQAVFIFSLGWFIRLLLKFAKDLKNVEFRIDGVEKKSNSDIAQVRQEIAITKERENNIYNVIRQINSKLDKICDTIYKPIK